MPIDPKTGKHLPYTKANVAKAKKKGWPMSGKKKVGGLTRFQRKGY